MSRKCTPHRLDAQRDVLQCARRSYREQMSAIERRSLRPLMADLGRLNGAYDRHWLLFIDQVSVTTHLPGITSDTARRQIRRGEVIRSKEPENSRSATISASRRRLADGDKCFVLEKFGRKCKCCLYVFPAKSRIRVENVVDGPAICQRSRINSTDIRVPLMIGFPTKINATAVPR